MPTLKHIIQKSLVNIKNCLTPLIQSELKFYQISNLQILIQSTKRFIVCAGDKYMDQDLKKKIIIGLTIGAAIIGGIFIKNKIQQSKFKPLSRQRVLEILNKTRKQNYLLYKQIATVSANIATQMGQRQIDPQMTKAYLESPQSPLKIQQTIQNNYTNVCNNLQVKYSQFNRSVEYYIQKQDAEIKSLVDDTARDYTQSFKGKAPQIKVKVPETLTQEKLLAVQKKLTIKKYLIQIEMFRKLRGKSQQQLVKNPQLYKSLPNPQKQQQKILQQEEICDSDQPASLVFKTAIQKYRGNKQFQQKALKVENYYAQIFNKYKLKMQQNKITEDEINQLQDQIIFAQVQG